MFTIDKLENTTVENVYSVSLHELDSNSTTYKAILKLHKQFPHLPEKKLTALLKDSAFWREYFKEYTTKIYQEYQECQLC